MSVKPQLGSSLIDFRLFVLAAALRIRTCWLPDVQPPDVQRRDAPPPERRHGEGRGPLQQDSS